MLRKKQYIQSNTVLVKKWEFHGTPWFKFFHCTVHLVIRSIFFGSPLILQSVTSNQMQLLAKNGDLNKGMQNFSNIITDTMTQILSPESSWGNYHLLWPFSKMSFNWKWSLFLLKIVQGEKENIISKYGFCKKLLR